MIHNLINDSSVTCPAVCLSVSVSGRSLSLTTVWSRNWLTPLTPAQRPWTLSTPTPRAPGCETHLSHHICLSVCLSLSQSLSLTCLSLPSCLSLQALSCSVVFQMVSNVKVLFSETELLLAGKMSMVTTSTVLHWSILVSSGLYWSLMLQLVLMVLLVSL